jgi:hypothetical protein
MSALKLQNETRLDYALYRTGSRKKPATGETDSGSPWDHIANDVVKKLAHEEK